MATYKNWKNTILDNEFNMSKNETAKGSLRGENFQRFLLFKIDLTNCLNVFVFLFGHL